MSGPRADCPGCGCRHQIEDHHIKAHDHPAGGLCGGSYLYARSNVSSGPMSYVTIRLPRADWDQIVSDIENMCGVGAEEIEILQNVEVLAL